MKKLFPELIQTIDSLKAHAIPEDRQSALQPLTDFMQAKIDANQRIRINFICTHNSRRSHLAQIWAQSLAEYVGLHHFNAYSGGTESTALYPKVIETLTKQGFQVERLSTEKNPIYSVKFAENEPAVIGFSKRLDHSFNPSSGFAAVMTCSQADAGCPFVPGAEKRIPITFEDPKLFDETPQQTLKYQERSLQIAAELCYVFNNLKLT